MVIDDVAMRWSNLTQINRGDSHYSIARTVFHDKQGGLRHYYQECQDDQMGPLGLVLNIIVLWNTIYMHMETALNQLRMEGYPVSDEDVGRLSPLLNEQTTTCLNVIHFRCR
jgi:TnpA family transposase